MAFLAGLKVVEMNDQRAVVSIPYTFLNKNPFRSIYFACLGMAAELSTGILATWVVRRSASPVSMLVVKIEADFTKKAVGKIFFTCNEGNLIAQTVEACMSTGEGKAITVSSIGNNREGEKVAEFKITWSFKEK